MQEKLLEQIDRSIEACRTELAQDIIKLIGVRSVKGDPLPDGATQIGLLLAEPLVKQGWLLERQRHSPECGEVIEHENGRIVGLQFHPERTGWAEPFGLLALPAST